MSGLKKHIYEEKNGLHYTLNGDYYLPDLKLPEEHRPIKEVLLDKADEKKAQRTAPAQTKHKQQDMEL